MSFLESVRRLGIPVVGVLAAAALCVACSSSSSGTPESQPAQTLGKGPASVSASVPASVAESTPAGNPPPSSSAPALSGAPFCSEFKTSDLAGLGSPSDLSTAVSTWDKFTSEAPSDIKPDFQKIDDYLHSASAGQVPSAAQEQQLAPAVQHIVQWITTNCTGG